MKRISILCDGTWNKTDTRHPTNVVRLARMIAPVDAKGIAQVPVYIPGVGTGKGVTAFARWSDRVLGGALGLGLLENIVDAYRTLVFLYEPGDQIFVFGFSRGAYTARSLAGLIRSTGIIERDTLWMIPEAVARYRIMDRPSTAPETVASFEHRLKMSPRVATSRAEMDWRRDLGAPEPHPLKVAYLGVWDTVGALGVPAHLSVAGLFNRRKYEFHDARLSRIVCSARHAIALDERRRTYEPTRWVVPNGADEDDGTADAPYQERFFAGDHGSVGGGGEISDLSSIALHWIAEGAERADLAMIDRETARVAAQRCPLGPLRNTKRPEGWLERLYSRRDRHGPDRIAGLHESVHTRWAHESSDPGWTPYRPGSLRRLQAEMDAHQAAGADTQPGPDTDRA